MGDLLTTVFPGECRVCEEPLVWVSGAPVCLGCMAQVRRRTSAACVRCGDRMEAEAQLEDMRFEQYVCRVCRVAPPAFERAVAYGAYDGTLRALLHLLKYDGMEGVAKDLGERLAEAAVELQAEAAGGLLVVAVPLHGRVERERGFNQSRLIADSMIGRLALLRPEWTLEAAHDVLARRKRTAAQFQLSQRERRRNLAGAFAVTGQVRGREVLLVDDILTTGATARECAQVLRAAGAQRVWVATVARATDEDFDTLQAHTASWDLQGSALSSNSVTEPRHTEETH